MIHHHPDDTLLMAMATGHQAAGAAIVVGSHVEGCPACQGRVRQLEAVGGVLLEDIVPHLLHPGALGRTLAALDAPTVAQRPAPSSVKPRPALPDGAHWPQALDHCDIAPWRWLGPGVHMSRITVPYDRAANVFLLRIGAGKLLPVHTHSELELTQVLCGEFHDGRSLFGPGDFDGADPSIHHQPVVQSGGECICLAAVEGKLVFDSFLARTFGALVGM